MKRKLMSLLALLFVCVLLSSCTVNQGTTGETGWEAENDGGSTVAQVPIYPTGEAALIGSWIGDLWRYPDMPTRYVLSFAPDGHVGVERLMDDTWEYEEGVWWVDGERVHLSEWDDNYWNARFERTAEGLEITGSSDHGKGGILTLCTDAAETRPRMYAYTHDPTGYWEVGAFGMRSYSSVNFLPDGTLTGDLSEINRYNGDYYAGANGWRLQRETAHSEPRLQFLVNGEPVRDHSVYNTDNSALYLPVVHTYSPTDEGWVQTISWEKGQYRSKEVFSQSVEIPYIDWETVQNDYVDTGSALPQFTSKEAQASIDVTIKDQVSIDANETLGTGGITGEPDTDNTGIPDRIGDVEYTGNDEPTNVYDTPIKNDRYEAVDGNFSWTEANDMAQSRGGYLATITSQEEQAIIEGIMADKYLGYWVGAQFMNGEWRWVTGEVFTYSNWADGEPNGNNDQYQEYYLGIWGLYETSNFVPVLFTWNDFPLTASRMRGFIIEFPHADVSTEPQTTKDMQTLFGSYNFALQYIGDIDASDAFNYGILFWKEIVIAITTGHSSIQDIADIYMSDPVKAKSILKTIVNRIFGSDNAELSAAKEQVKDIDGLSNFLKIFLNCNVPSDEIKAAKLLFDTSDLLQKAVTDYTQNIDMLEAIRSVTSSAYLQNVVDDLIYEYRHSFALEYLQSKAKDGGFKLVDLFVGSNLTKIDSIIHAVLGKDEVLKGLDTVIGISSMKRDAIDAFNQLTQTILSGDGTAENLKNHRIMFDLCKELTIEEYTAMRSNYQDDDPKAVYLDHQLAALHNLTYTDYSYAIPYEEYVNNGNGNGGSFSSGGGSGGGGGGGGAGGF